MLHGNLSRLLSFIVFSAFVTAPAFAQQLQLTAPVQTVVLNEGDDFASTVLQNPWDMSERRDIGYEEQFVGPSISAQGGVWTGINAGPGGYVFPLFGGFKGGLHAEAPGGDRSLPRYGNKHPIDTGKYRLLSFRLRSSSRSMLALYWSSLVGPTFFPDGQQFGASLDGVRAGQQYLFSDYNIYTFDIPTAAFENRAGSWSGNVHALRIDPSVGAPAGASTEIDWIRLVDPRSAGRLAITWNELSIPLGSVITVWAQGGGFPATPLARYIADGQQRFLPAGAEYSTTPSLPSSNGRHELSAALLPAGSYQFFVTASRPAAGQLIELARSGASSIVRINAAPALSFFSPSETSGADYASEALGNPWDMSDLADVANLPSSLLPQTLRQYLSPSFAGGLFQAVTEPPLPGNAQGDPQVLLSVSANRPIDPQRFRYLTYRLAADDTLFPTIHDKIAYGWVTRPVFWNNDFFGEGASTFGHPLYEGFHTYTIDLWDNSILERGVPWKSLASIRHLRIDPIETTQPTWFFIDSVNLTAENVPTGGQFNVDFQVGDSDGTPVNVSFYADTDATGFNGPLVAGLGNLLPGRHSFSFPASQLARGRYYLFAVLNDGVDVRRVYAPVPIVNEQTAIAAPRRKVPLDFDGDEQSDPVVLRRARKSMVFTKLSTRLPYGIQLGGAGASLLPGDFDGDGISDLNVVQAQNNVFWWSTQLSSTGVVESRIWGMPGDIAVPADYNGDGQEDLAIYRAGVWYVLYRNGTVAIAAWGLPTDVPVPADFDGDGKADLTVYRPSDGTWWSLLTGFGSGISAVGHRAQQWGLPGDIPLPEDFDGDGKADFVVYRPSTSTWFIRSSGAGSQVEMTQWGLPGDQPIVGDFTGDGRLDLTVYRPWSGEWFVHDRAGSTFASQWGLAGDVPPLP